jgi:signal transduction histidine kinase
MAMRLSHTLLLRYTGLFTWFMAGVPLLYAWIFPGQDATLGQVALDTPWLSGWATAHCVFGIAYWWLTRSLGERRTSWVDNLLLALLTMSAVCVSYFTGTGLGSILLMVIAGLLPWLLTVPVGIAVLLAGNLVVVPVYVRALNYPMAEAWMQALLYAGFSSFTFVIGLVAKQQAQAREDQRRLNSELRATRALLAESSRMSERLRISRELHDLLGHHLTALSLNLEVAGHLTEGKAQEHVKQSHTLARLLLTDVREVVSEMREERGIDLGVALRTLVEGVPALDVVLEVPERLEMEDADRAQILLRCAQEIVTNAVRHAGASHLWLRVEEAPGVIRLHARDDGVGGLPPKPGNGLNGMRERLAAYGGKVDIITSPGQGFALDVCLPLEITP